MIKEEYLNQRASRIKPESAPHVAGRARRAVANHDAADAGGGG